MRKTMRKILAVVLCLSVLLTLSPLAFAASATDDGGFNFQGIYRIKQGEVITIDVPAKALAAEDYDVEDMYGMLTVSNADASGKITVIAQKDAWGTTVLTFSLYDVYEEDGDTWYDWIEDINYAVFIYDDEDTQMTGRVTGVTVGDDDVKCDESGWLDYEVEQDGDVYWDTLVYYEGEGVDVDYDGEFYAYDRGSVDGVLYVIDSNGNIVSDTFTITSTFTIWQWVKYIVRTIIYSIIGRIIWNF